MRGRIRNDLPCNSCKMIQKDGQLSERRIPRAECVSALIFMQITENFFLPFRISIVYVTAHCNADVSARGDRRACSASTSVNKENSHTIFNYRSSIKFQSVVCDFYGNSYCWKQIKASQKIVLSGNCYRSDYTFGVLHIFFLYCVFTNV